jgi:phosphotransferase system  glucose/maltose/N-acetylglucosamine-specific IIC component
VVWAAAYAVVAASFVLIVIPSAWGDPGGSLWLWVAVVGGFAVVAVGVYLYFRYLAKPIEDDDAEEPVLESASS